MTARNYYREEIVPNEPGAQPVVREQVSVEPDLLHTPLDQPARGMVRERVSGPDGVHTTVSEQVYQPTNAEVRTARSFKAQRIVYYVVGVISVLLLVRFALLMFGANSQAPFVDFMYTLTQPFTYPFQGIFGEPVFGSSVLEWASLVAIAVYMLIAAGLVKLLNLTRPTLATDF